MDVRKSHQKVPPIDGYMQQPAAQCESRATTSIVFTKYTTYSRIRAIGLLASVSKSGVIYT
jgi:hypothetical protein